MPSQEVHDLIHYVDANACKTTRRLLVFVRLYVKDYSANLLDTIRH